MRGKVWMKLGFLFGVLLLAVFAGSLFAGWLVKVLIGVEVAVEWNTWLRYFQALETPRMQPYVWKVKVAGYAGFGLPLLAWLGLAVLALKPRQQSLHGDARFATLADVAKAGFFDSKKKNGVVIGKYKGKLMRLTGQQFVILAAPTRSGKGVGIVIPNLLDYGESMVVLDIKQENFNLTSGWRKSQGHEVYLFNPFAEDRRTHRWNPLSYVSHDPSFRISDIQAIAAMLYPDVSDEQKFWVSQARNAFTAFSLYLFENHFDEVASGLPEDIVSESFPTLGRIYRISSGDGTELKEYFRGLLQRPFLSSHCRMAFANLLSQADDTFSSIMGTFKEPLNAWVNPVLDMATSSNDFWLTEVRKRKMTVYIGIQPNKLAESRLIVNLFFSQLINVNTKELPQDNPALKYQCLLLMDEFTSIGKVGIIASAVSYMAGYNVRLLPIIQSVSQLDATYGREVARTLITNHALQIIYAPREQQDANEYSEMLGYTTVRKQNRSRSRGQQGSVTFSESEERRALMLPQELKAMGNDKEIVLYEGLAQPVKAEKIRYYQDKYFTSRLLPKVEVKPLAIGEGEASMKAGKQVKAAVTAVALAGLAACAPVGDVGAGQPPPETERALTEQEADFQAGKEDVEAALRGILERPYVPMQEPLPYTPAPKPEPSEAMLRARAQNGRLTPEDLQARIFRYIDSLQRLEDTHIDNIQKQMGLVIPPAQGREEFRSEYSDYLTDGGWVWISVGHPGKEEPLTYSVTVASHDGDSTPQDVPCRYGLDAFAELLQARGFAYEGQGVHKPYRSFGKNMGDIGVGVQLLPRVHVKPDGSRENCVAEVRINMGRIEW